MVASINLEGMSLQQLKSLKSNVESAIASYDERMKKQRAKAKLEREARKLQTDAQELGYSLEDLFGAGAIKAKSSVRAKYRNPDDESQTWSGRGRPPHWVNQAREKGLDLSDLLIPES